MKTSAIDLAVASIPETAAPRDAAAGRGVDVTTNIGVYLSGLMGGLGALLTFRCQLGFRGNLGIR